MKKQQFIAVIGKNFGDEGKGLAVDYFSSCDGRVLVIRHNGGAQSGHTVEYPDRRFVFHQLSSGSFQGADTFWADTFFPDLYKLEGELAAFSEVAGFLPKIYAHTNTRITVIDDVLINMAAEECRGQHRHGSCAMGIYEACCRSDSGFGISIGELSALDTSGLTARLKEIRRLYLPSRLNALGLSGKVPQPYCDLLQDDNVLQNAAAQILCNLKYVQPTEALSKLIESYDRIIFEGGQGLLLDWNMETFAPHITASRTGLANPCRLLQAVHASLDEAVYVTRTYVTRHGAGPLPHQCTPEDLGIRELDVTNTENPWQGQLRYARHNRLPCFTKDIKEDLQQVSLPKASLFLTHLNQTAQYILTQDGNYPIEEFCCTPEISEVFDKVYLSASRFSKDVIPKFLTLPNL